MQRHELKLQLSTDADIEDVKRILRGLEKSGKVKVHWIRSQEIGPIGRPAETRAKVLAYLETQDYPKSAKQIGSALQKAPTSLYRVLHGLVAEGQLQIVEDDRWHTRRFGDATQVRRMMDREKRRQEAAERRVINQIRPDNPVVSA